jgi:HPt (histidine-containing phosphotransfer) domain-containing protein
METMSEAISRDDRDSFVRAAHTLKSNSATVGATLLSSLGASLEQAGKTEALSSLQEKLDAAREEFSLVKPRLEEMLSAGT